MAGFLKRKILARQAVIPGVDFRWSDSLVHNAFRCFELIFGRKPGIRLEQIADTEGNNYSYTLENYLTSCEYAAKALLKRQQVRVVHLSPALVAGARMGDRSPYSFSIAYVTSANVDQTLSTLTISLTTSGSNPGVVTAGKTNQNFNISGATYNSVAMSSAENFSPLGSGANGRVYMFVQGNSSSGANNVVVTAAGVSEFSGMAAAYSGIANATQPDAHNNGSANPLTSQTVSVTTVADNAWAFSFEFAFASAPTASTGVTQRIAFAGNQWGFGDSNADITPAGSYSMTWTASSGVMNMAMASMSPAVSAGTTPIVHMLGLLGIGS